MRSVHRERESGLVATFVIVGVVLVTGLAGGVYFLTQQSSDEAAVTERRETAQEDRENRSSEPEQKTHRSDDSEERESPASDTPNPAAREQPAPPGIAQGGVDANALPQTGSRDLFANLMGLSALTFASLYYVRSRSL